MKLRLVKSLGSAFVGTALLFSGLVGMGTSLVLLASSCIGYLPYSDRPGPGWWGRVHAPSWAEFVQYIGFAPLFAYFCLYFGLGIFGFSLVLSISSAPRWLSRLLGGMVCAVAAGLAVLGAGWYFALAVIGLDAAILLGLIYGALLFPSFVRPLPQPLPWWARIGATTVATLLLLYWMASPLLPKAPVPAVRYEVMRVASGDQAVNVSPSLGPEISRDLAALNLRGQLRGGASGYLNATGRAVPEIDVALIALEAIATERRLPIPAKGHVIYVLKDGEWTAHPSISKKDKRTLTIMPGADAKYDGGQLKTSRESEWTAFTWYPVIPRH